MKKIAADRNYKIATVVERNEAYSILIDAESILKTITQDPGVLTDPAASKWHMGQAKTSLADIRRLIADYEHTDSLGIAPSNPGQ